MTLGHLTFENFRRRDKPGFWDSTFSLLRVELCITGTDRRTSSLRIRAGSYCKGRTPLKSRGFLAFLASKGPWSGKPWHAHWLQEEMQRQIRRASNVKSQLRATGYSSGQSLRCIPPKQDRTMACTNICNGDFTSVYTFKIQGLF